jgi:hypothetical protein
LVSPFFGWVSLVFLSASAFASTRFCSAVAAFRALAAVTSAAFALLSNSVCAVASTAPDLRRGGLFACATQPSRISSARRRALYSRSRLTVVVSG